jgi:hypothetical protein
MTPSAFIVMVVSIAAVLSLTIFCMYRVLTLPPAEVEDLRSPLDIDTKDTENPD